MGNDEGLMVDRGWLMDGMFATFGFHSSIFHPLLPACPMTLRLLFFSVLQDITGVAEMAFECAQGSCVGDLLSLLYQRWPELARWDGSLLVAMDHGYVRRDALLVDGAELAIMPPVQGG
jgi:molybdopterin synthase sulfur carrier subunit